MIHVVAVLTAQPGQRDALLAAFDANRAAVLAEPGCIEYAATIEAACMPPGKESFGVDTVVIIEKWADLAALQAHSAAPHMVAFGATTKPLLSARVIHVLEPVVS